MNYKLKRICTDHIIKTKKPQYQHEQEIGLRPTFLTLAIGERVKIGDEKKKKIADYYGVKVEDIFEETATAASKEGGK